MFNAVPLYTEDSYPLQRTLEHLAMQQEDMRKCYRAFKLGEQARRAASGGETAIPVHAEMAANQPLDALNDGLYEPTIHVLVVADGVERVSASMTKFLTEMFPAYSEDLFTSWSEITPLPGADVRMHFPGYERVSGSGPRAAIFHRVASVGPSTAGSHAATEYHIQPLELDLSLAVNSKARDLDRNLAVPIDADGLENHEDMRPIRKLYVTLLVKECNRKKHNSQRWFFDLFAKLCVQKCATQFYFVRDRTRLKKWASLSCTRCV